MMNLRNITDLHLANLPLLNIVEFVRVLVIGMSFPSQAGWTPLMWASHRGKVDCVELLMHRGAQANQEVDVSIDLHGTCIS